MINCLLPIIIITFCLLCSLPYVHSPLILPCLAANHEWNNLKFGFGVDPSYGYQDLLFIAILTTLRTNNFMYLCSDTDKMCSVVF